ncbi:peptidase inhibitor family I36 protein [Streptomyces sp. NPDC051561]|uniref:peptidase inhibitor family I36 protein n=1 Tax=Streptomyces sp. NPDC051561 TaxID=3365658 RepID=UPI0037BD2A5F
MQRKIAAALLAGVALAVSVAPAAQAAQSYNGVCDDHEVCNYRLANYSGGIADFYTNIPDYDGYAWFNYGGNINDSTSSLKNNADLNILESYQHKNAGGGYFTTGTNGKRASFTSTWDNTVSSHYF